MTMDQVVNLQGPSGLIEAILSQPAVEAPIVAIICHPHPLHGGSLQNKVVHTLMRTFRELMITSVRFNFRGVGKSEGHYDRGIGEVDDAIAVLSWVKMQYPQATIWFSGFSFGAFVAAAAVSSKVKTAHTIEQLIMVAPPVETFDFSVINFSLVSTCVVMGEQDDIVAPIAVKNWAKQHPIVDMLWLPEADHFFHGRLSVLKDILMIYLQRKYPGLSSRFV